MIDLHSARMELAAAASSPSIPCLPYTPDNPLPPIAFIDTLGLQAERPGSVLMPWLFRAQIVAVGQRHDRAAATTLLEGDVNEVLPSLEAIRGLRVLEVLSGTVEIGKTELPAVTYTVELHM